jgi:hypothetical protein
LILLVATFGIGYIGLGLIAVFHSGAIGDAPRDLSQKDLERIAAANNEVPNKATLKETK